MNAKEAQRRADAIRTFREELERLEEEGVLRLDDEEKAVLREHHEATLRDLAERFDVDTSREAKQISWGMRIASLLAALAMAAGIFFLFFQFWGYLSTPIQVVVLVAAPLLAVAGTDFVARRERGIYFTALVALVAFTAFVLNLSVLGKIFNVRASPDAFLAWSAFALVLAYGYGLRLLQTAGILALGGWLSAQVGTWGGCYWLSFGERPENFIAAGLVLFAVPLVVRSRRGEGFDVLWRLWGLLGVFLAVLILANFGRVSYLTMDPAAVEILYQCLGFVLCGLAVWIGIRRSWRETSNLGVTFLVIFLYTKFFDWWWDWMPKWAFFLILGAIGVALLFGLRWFRGWRKEAEG